MVETFAIAEKGSHFANSCKKGCQLGSLLVEEVQYSALKIKKVLHNNLTSHTYTLIHKPLLFAEVGH